MEYMYKAEYHHETLSWHDFLLDHSMAYLIAMFVSFSEYMSRSYFKTNALVSTFENSKITQYIMYYGLFQLYVGHFFRIWAMFHAKKNFNHEV